MESAARITDRVGQARLQRRVNVLVLEADLPFALFESRLEGSQPVAECMSVGMRYQILGGKHLGVRD